MKICSWQLGFFLVAFLVAGQVTSASAAVVVSYNLTGAAGNQATQAPASAATHITGLSITRGSGLSAAAAVNSFSSSGWEGNAGNPLTDVEYISLGFSVESGFSVDLTNFIFGTQSSGTGPGTIGVYLSQNGFATSATQVLPSISQAPGSNQVNTTLNLSAFTGLTGTVELRFIEIGNTSANGGTTAAGGTFQIAENGDNDVLINGTINTLDVTVPEPGTLMTVGGLLGLYGLTACRRQRKAA